MGSCANGRTRPDFRVRARVKVRVRVKVGARVRARVTIRVRIRVRDREKDSHGLSVRFSSRSVPLPYSNPASRTVRMRGLGAVDNTCVRMRGLGNV